MPISAEGWELHVERLGLHLGPERPRTYGRYQVTIDGVPQEGLDGYMVESAGPGDNTMPDNGRRLAAGRYRLTTHYRTYVSAGYSTNTSNAGDTPMPAVRLLDTDKRTGILIHPVYPPERTLFLAAVGCLNPTSAVGPEALVGFWDSRGRVIAILDSLRAFRPAAFAETRPAVIEGAVVVIDGEPMHRLSS
jgi:hypothetical protein